MYVLMFFCDHKWLKNEWLDVQLPLLDMAVAQPLLFCSGLRTVTLWL